jgi:hypothetical protein
LEPLDTYIASNQGTACGSIIKIEEKGRKSICTSVPCIRFYAVLLILFSAAREGSGS